VFLCRPVRDGPVAMVHRCVESIWEIKKPVSRVALLNTWNSKTRQKK
jgi:hypothetical protein